MDIDCSKAEWVVPVAKKALSIRLDQDIVDVFPASGKGYQTRINAVLRDSMSEEKGGVPNSSIRSSATAAPRAPR